MKRLFNEALADAKKDVISLNASDFFSYDGLNKKVKQESDGLNHYTSREPVLESQFRDMKSWNPPIQQQMTKHEPEYNLKISLNRSIYPVSQHTRSIEKFELGLVYKKSEGFMTSSAMLTRGPFADAEKPVHLLNPVVFNSILCDNQIFLAKSDPKKYYAMTAWDFWKDWSVDGVVTHVRGLEDGMNKSIDGPEEIKRATLSTKGGNFIQNYWAESNPSPGSDCYAVIKKYDRPEYYVIDDKGTQKKPTYNETGEGDYKGRLKPFQIGFFCVPRGSSPPLAMKEYKDEWGYKGYGIFIKIGSALTTPRKVLPYYTPGNSEYQLVDKPFTDNTIGFDPTSVTMMKIIMDPNDGIVPT